jgi:hypothetical protein
LPDATSNPIRMDEALNSRGSSSLMEGRALPEHDPDPDWGQDFDEIETVGGVA